MNRKKLQQLLILMLLALCLPAAALEDKEEKVALTGDGPYVIYNADGTVRVITVSPQGTVNDTTYQALPQDLTLSVADHNGQYPFRVRLHPITRPAWKQEQPDKTFIMSDPHGRLNLVISLLQNNGVIDKNLCWSFGSNTLVVIGDIIDRGYDVTQIYWLFYKLEQEAAQAGGNVSVMLGNHEPMELAGDMRYAKPKYKLLADTLGMEYRRLLWHDTELGRWLATRNTMQLVGRNLFVHAGLSHEFYDRGMQIPAVNDSISSLLFMKSKERRAHSELGKFLYGNRGPIWYRGLVLKTKKWSPLPSDSLSMILNRYGADRLFVGHTIFKDIRRFYKGRVIAVNVDNKENYEHQRGRAVLLTKEGDIFVVGDKGIKRKLK